MAAASRRRRRPGQASKGQPGVFPTESEQDSLVSIEFVGKSRKQEQLVVDERHPPAFKDEEIVQLRAKAGDHDVKKMAEQFEEEQYAVRFYDDDEWEKAYKASLASPFASSRLPKPEPGKKVDRPSKDPTDGDDDQPKEEWDDDEIMAIDTMLKRRKEAITGVPEDAEEEPKTCKERIMEAVEKFKAPVMLLVGGLAFFAFKMEQLIPEEEKPEPALQAAVKNGIKRLQQLGLFVGVIYIVYQSLLTVGVVSIQQIDSNTFQHYSFNASENTKMVATLELNETEAIQKYLDDLKSARKTTVYDRMNRRGSFESYTDAEKKELKAFLCQNVPIQYYEETKKFEDGVEFRDTKTFRFSCNLMPVPDQGNLRMVYLFGVNSPYENSATPKGIVQEQRQRIDVDEGWQKKEPKGLTDWILFNKTQDHFQEFEVRFNHQKLRGVTVNLDLYHTAKARNRTLFNGWQFETHNQWIDFAGDSMTKEIFKGQPIVIGYQAHDVVFLGFHPKKEIYTNFQPPVPSFTSQGYVRPIEEPELGKKKTDKGKIG